MMRLYLFSEKKNVRSNHPKNVFKRILNNIKIKLSTKSSNIDICTQNKQDCEIALQIVDKKKTSNIKVEKTIQTYRI